MPVKINEHLEDGDFYWITFEADPQVFKDQYMLHFRKAVKNVLVDGFRKGHAPFDAAIKQMKARGRFAKEMDIVLNNVIKVSVSQLPDVDKELDEKVFGLPIENKAIEMDLENWKFIFSSKFERFPQIELGDYSEITTLIEHKEGNDICPVPLPKEAEQTDVVAVSMLGKDKDSKPINKYTYDMLEIDLENTKLPREIVEAIIGGKSRDKKEVKLKDGDREINIDIWIIEVRKKEKIDDELVKRLNVPNGETVEKFKETINKQYLVHNSFVRYHDILKWLFSSENNMNPVPHQNIRREAANFYNLLIKQGHNKISFENVVLEQMKNLKTTLVLGEIAKKEGIKVEAGDKENFANHIDEYPWLYGNRASEDVFNCDEKVLEEYILQFKTIRFLDERWKFKV